MRGELSIRLTRRLHGQTTKGSASCALRYESPFKRIHGEVIFAP